MCRHESCTNSLLLLSNTSNEEAETTASIVRQAAHETIILCYFLLFLGYELTTQKIRIRRNAEKRVTTLMLILVEQVHDRRRPSRAKLLGRSHVDGCLSIEVGPHAQYSELQCRYRRMENLETERSAMFVAGRVKKDHRVLVPLGRGPSSTRDVLLRDVPRPGEMPSKPMLRLVDLDDMQTRRELQSKAITTSTSV